jgi:AcrR family transcriptional regulator
VSSEATAAPPRPLRADAQRNYDRILEVACDAFREHGVQTSLDDIAKRAGVGAGTLYRHFPNRDCLLAAALGEGRQALDQVVVTCLSREDAGEALNEWLIAVAVYLGSYDGLADSVAQAIHDDSSPLGTPCTALKASTATLLKRAQEAGAVRADVNADDLFVLASSLAWAADSNGYDHSDLRRLLTLVTVGLR